MNRLRAGISLCNVTFYWVNGSGGGGGDGRDIGSREK